MNSIPWQRYQLTDLKLPLQIETKEAGMNPKPRILHVDDNAGVRDAYQIMLREDFEVIGFSSVAAAKAATAEQSFDYFLCDGEVDKENDGAEWALELHQQGKKVILVSGKQTIQPEFDVLPRHKKSSYTTDLIALIKSM